MLADGVPPTASDTSAPRVAVNCTRDRVGVFCFDAHKTSTVASAMIADAANAHGNARRHRGTELTVGALAALGSCEAALTASSISMPADVMSPSRFLRSFSRLRRSRRRIDAGVFTGKAFQSGSFVST